MNALAFSRRGAGPPLVLLHALGSSRSCWAPVVPALAERFEVVTKPDQAGLVTFRPETDPTDLVTQLREQGVIVRELPGRNLIRVSCGYWTSEEDLDRLLDGLTKALS